MFKDPLSIYTEQDAATAHIDGDPHKRECVAACESAQVSCPNKECRYWIDYADDLNCTFVTVDKNEGGLTLREIGERLGVSFVRVCQIEKGVLEKLKKKIQNTVLGK
tara:strand:- start:8566 stop:8886 length:321 start_codon:yes stop_codon:yes gene_type:complete